MRRRAWHTRCSRSRLYAPSHDARQTIHQTVPIGLVENINWPQRLRQRI